MRNLLGIFVIAFAVLATISGCKKSEEFVNPVHKCQCGTISWNGETYDLLSAEYIQTSPTNPLSRRYYITASVAGENESQAHNINFTFATDTVTNGVFFIPGDDSAHLVEEVDFNDVNEIDGSETVTEYLGVEGIVTVNPNVLGGNEKVSFTFNVKEVYEGALVGFAIPFSGSFNVRTNPL